VGSYALSPSLLASSDITRFDSVNEYYRKIFIKPYMRWNAYLIGIFIGYVIRRTDKSRSAMGLKYLQMGPISIIAWAVIVALCSTLVYGLHNFASGHGMNQAAIIIYASFARTIWSLAIGILLLLLLRTKGGLAKWFLTWPIWIPLSRLTYCAFLLHSMTSVFFYGTAKEWLQFNFGNMIYFWLSTLIISYGLGLIAYLCVEAPSITIGRLFFARPVTEETSAANELVAMDSSKLLVGQDANGSGGDKTKNILR